MSARIWIEWQEINILRVIAARRKRYMIHLSAPYLGDIPGGLLLEYLLAVMPDVLQWLHH